MCKEDPYRFHNTVWLLSLISLLYWIKRLVRLHWIKLSRNALSYRNWNNLVSSFSILGTFVMVITFILSRNIVPVATSKNESMFVTSAERFYSSSNTTVICRSMYNPRLLSVRIPYGNSWLKLLSDSIVCTSLFPSLFVIQYLLLIQVCIHIILFTVISNQRMCFSEGKIRLC